MEKPCNIKNKNSPKKLVSQGHETWADKSKDLKINPKQSHQKESEEEEYVSDIEISVNK